MKEEIKTPICKTDNVLQILLNGLKMIQMHVKLVAAVKAYAMKRYF